MLMFGLLYWYRVIAPVYVVIREIVDLKQGLADTK